jgi:hypothetical protein
MKSLIMQSTRHIFAVLFLLLCATQVQATTVTVTEIGFFGTNSVYNYNSSGFNRGSAGMFEYKVDGYETFGFCIDLSQGIAEGEYQLVELSTFTQVDASDLERTNLLGAAWLIDNFAEAANTNYKKAALQLAIWETVYGDVDFLISDCNVPDTDYFTSRDNRYNDTANDYLGRLSLWNQADTTFAANYKVLYSADHQDQLIYYPVPEPSTLILLLAGLVGLWFIVKRRNKV